MIKITAKIYDQIESLANTVKDEFKRKGVAIPHKNKNGSVQIGNYSIIKRDSVYWIELKGYPIAGPINLAETAALIANDLALGKHIDGTLIYNDTWFGYKSFDEQSYRYNAEMAKKKKQYDRLDHSIVRADIAHKQKMEYKKPIAHRFAKLCNKI